MFNKLLDPEGSNLPRRAELGPQIAVVLQCLEELALSQLAAEVMTRAFQSEWTPGAEMVELGAITDCFLPDYGPPRAGDTASAEEHALNDLIAEGIQVLEHARLVRPAFGYGGNLAGYGWVTTRLGRSALASGSVQRAVERNGG